MNKKGTLMQYENGARRGSALGSHFRGSWPPNRRSEGAAAVRHPYSVRTTLQFYRRGGYCRPAVQSIISQKSNANTYNFSIPHWIVKQFGTHSVRAANSRPYAWCGVLYAHCTGIALRLPPQPSVRTGQLPLKWEPRGVRCEPG